jgi:hypothetical protein
MCISPASGDGVVDDDGVGLGEATVAGAVELVEEMLGDAVVAPGVEETGVPSWSSEADGDELADSPAAVGLVRWLVDDEL